MFLAFQYKLLPTYEQRCRMDKWLDMLRYQYNYLLAERFDWWERNRCPISACPLVCHLPELKEPPNYYSQKRSLVTLKQDREWYKDLHADVLQDMVKRVDLAFARYLKGRRDDDRRASLDVKGNRSGKPRFKGKGRYRTFTFPRLGNVPVKENYLDLPKLGKVKFIQHRPLPVGFEIKTATVTKKPDGWYAQLVLDSSCIPEAPPIRLVPTEANSLGVDAGLEYFVACSDGFTKEPPKHFRKAEDKLAKLQVKLALRKKGSKARRKLGQRIARLHQTIARTRRQWHYETAGELLDRAEVLFIEDLKVANMNRRCKPKQDEDGKFLPNGQAAKSGLNKSFADAGIAGFLNDILPYKAAKAGKQVIKVNPAGTSQHCAKCLTRVPKELKDLWHSCPHCGVELPRDVNSGMLIKKVGLGVRLTIKREGRKTGEAHPIPLCG